MDFELNRMECAVRALNIFDGRWKPYIFQIIGTNGKGSTATFLESLARAHGFKTGLYTSPHFVTPRERIRINGCMAEAELLVPLANTIHNAAPELTYFEFLTVLGISAFKEAGIEILVIEAGLGGKYDATTALPVDTICYVPIALDHMNILGNTVTAIATDKAAAIREHCAVFSATQTEAAERVLKEAAAARQCTYYGFETAPSLPAGIRLGLRGSHQRDNARLALAAWLHAANFYKVIPDESAIRKGLQTAFIAGRCQLISANTSHAAVLLDGGHNPHGMRSLLHTVIDERITPSAVIFSCLGDKDYTSMLPMVLRLSDKKPLLICTIQDNERALSGEELAEKCRKACTGTEYAPSEIIIESRLATALRHAEMYSNFHDGGSNFPILICGSLYLLGEFFTSYPQYLEAPRR